MKILIIGSGGRLGAALFREYSERHECVGLARGDIDLSSLESIDTVLRSQQFELAINCAALTNVDYCERNRDEAMLVNGNAPGRMAEICKAKGARLVQVSTDYVLDGKQEGAIYESVKPTPISIYGESKLLGEQLVLKVDQSFMVVRVSWVFGPDRPSFIDMILNRARDNEHVEAIADKFSSPTYTHDFAEYLEPLLERNDTGGLLHLCNSGGTSWREYGEHALPVAAACGVPLKTTTVHPIQLAEMKNFVAARPIHTILSTARYTELTGATPRPWQQAVDAYINDYAAPKILAELSDD